MSPNWDRMQRIVYLSPPASVMTGGVKMLFRHVEALRESGFPACIATPDAEPPHWFETSAPMIPIDDVARHADVLVLPESRAEFFRSFAEWDNRKLVFCQSIHFVSRGLAGVHDYADFGVEAVICPSEAAAAYCRRRFPALKLFLVPYPLDRALFRPRAPKRLQIALMPRKRPLEASVIADLFRAADPKFRAIPWVVLGGLSEDEMAEALGDSLVYLSLSRFDSFGLSTLEAMSCGCVVAGFTGIGGREYATSKNGFWAPEDDCIACADQLILAVRLATEDGDRYRDFTDYATETAAHYSRERFRDRLTATWRTLIGDACAA